MADTEFAPKSGFMVLKAVYIFPLILFAVLKLRS